MSMDIEKGDPPQASMRSSLRLSEHRTRAMTVHHAEVPFLHGDVINKREALKEIDRLLGYDAPPAVEYLCVEDASACAPVGLGHACVRYTLRDGSERLANITRGRTGKDLSIVEMWERPEDYLFGSAGGKGGIFSRCICSLRMQRHDPDAIEAMHFFLRSLSSSHIAGSRSSAQVVGFSLIGIFKTAFDFIFPMGQRRMQGNCAQFCSQGLFLAGLLSRPHVFPKFVWVDMFEHILLGSESGVHVVYFKQPVTTHLWAYTRVDRKSVV